MKNLENTRTLDFRLKMRKLGRIISEKRNDFDWEIISEHKDMILKGLFWGISVSALLLSLYNVKSGHDMRKVAESSLLVSSDDTTANTAANIDAITDSLYADMQTSVETTLSKKLNEYMTNYISENGTASFFTTDTISIISKEVENDIISHLKETSTINATQEAIIREIIAEKIAEIDYSDIEEKIASSVKSLGTTTDEALRDLSHELAAEISAKVGNAVKNISSGIADELTRKDYTVGEYVTVEGKLYECIENVTVTDNNLSTVLEKYFKATSLTTALSTLSSELNTTINNLSESTNTSIANLTESVDKSLTSLSEGLTAEMDARYNELTESITNNYAELKTLTDGNAEKIAAVEALANSNAERITAVETQASGNTKAISALDSQLTATGNGTDFQFGYENNAYGYYVGGAFYPF